MTLANTVLEKHTNKILAENEFESDINEASAFEVSDNPQRGDTDGSTWIKNDEVIQLGKLLGLKVPKAKDITWGDYDTELDGIKIDVSADRSKPVIVITVGNMYDKRMRIKGGLSSSQIKNLRKKIEKQVQDRQESMNRGSMLADLGGKLRKKGLEVDYNGYIRVDGVELYRNEKGEIRTAGSVYYKGGLGVEVDGGEKAIDKALANVKKELMAQQQTHLKALEKAEKSKEDIDKYIELQNAGRK